MDQDKFLKMGAIASPRVSREPQMASSDSPNAHNKAAGTPGGLGSTLDSRQEKGTHHV
jgi:hypothetical protein